MIPRTLLERIFSAASITRWNDYPHPDVFSELGKQAHKMIIAWCLGKSEEDCGRTVNWQAIIEGGIFSFLHRVVVTDIRPPVFHRLMQDRETKTQLDEWVTAKLEPDLRAISLTQAFRDYHNHQGQQPEPLERRILDAAHYMATQWEFAFILRWNNGVYGIEQTKREVEANIDAIDLPSARLILDNPNGALANFISLVGQLSFQRRWAQTLRVPQTSVLGHLLFVAITSWLLSLEFNACPKRLYNNFFGGLFHDLPEVLTRDIISPVKTSVEGLGGLIRRYEQEAMNERVLPLLPESWRSELCWYTQEEFTNKTFQPEQIDPIVRHKGAIPDEFNQDEFNPMDGELIEVCDKLAAYIEASESIRTGIRSPELEDGKRSSYERFRRTPFGYLFEYFR